jgi:recombination protein RecA
MKLSAEILRSLAPATALAGAEARSLPVGIEAVDEALPDGGLPRGAVVELAGSHNLGQSTALALSLCASAQRQALLRGGQPAWCAWLDPGGSLYAPGVAALGVALDRLLVVRPNPDQLARVAARIVSSRVFSVVVIDTAGVPGASVSVPLVRWPNVVRRLALAAQGSDGCVLLLTELERSRAASLPVAMRLELARPSPERLSLRVAKERRGRIGALKELVYSRPVPDLRRKAS